MKPIEGIRFWMILVLLALLAAPSISLAQREVHWQINARAFPDAVSVFADVEDRGVFNRNMASTAFTISVDEYAGDMGGWILNADQPNMRGGATGAQVLIMIDKSRSYTKDFDKAKRMARAIAKGMRAGSDEVGIATFPTGRGYAETRLDLPFSGNLPSVLTAIERIEPMPKDDETGGRFCNALAEGIKHFPEKDNTRYRAIIFLTGGADKAEGKGNCYKDSYAAGKIPFYNMVFKLDRKYDDKRNAHKIENACHDLALSTGGRSIFRRSESEMARFIKGFWNRIQSQYFMQVSFPCYRPAPYLEHTSVLKVEGRDADGIKYEATSTPAPVPEITAIYPQQAYRNHVDDGKIDLTIDGKGFCGLPGQVKAFVGGRPVQIKTLSPYRIVASTGKSVETGVVKIANRFTQTGESPMKFEIIKPPKGAEASSTLMFLVMGVVGLIFIAVVIVALRSRKARVPMGAPPAASSVAPPVSQVPGSIPGTAPKTVAVGALSTAWIVKPDGTKIDLAPGPNLVGREAHCQVKVDVQGVSREHAKIELDPADNTVWAEDLGSTNGTLWGPEGAAESELQKLDQRRQFKTGEAIWIGGQKLSVFVTESTESRQEG